MKSQKHCFYQNVAYSSLMSYAHLWPRWCVACHHPTTDALDICTACLEMLPQLSDACYRCAEPLKEESIVCHRCQQIPPPYERVIAPFRYRGLIKNFLQAFKFHGQTMHAHWLGSLLAKTIAYNRSEPWPDFIVPVPLHHRKWRRRGFNQALLLATVISQHLQIPLRTWDARKTRYTQPQAGLCAKKRQQNVAHSFQVTTKPHTRIALVDDIITSGQTVAALTQAFLAAGAASVEVWCVAKQ